MARPYYLSWAVQLNLSTIWSFSPLPCSALLLLLLLRGDSCILIIWNAWMLIYSTWKVAQAVEYTPFPHLPLFQYEPNSDFLIMRGRSSIVCCFLSFFALAFDVGTWQQFIPSPPSSPNPQRWVYECSFWGSYVHGLLLAGTFPINLRVCVPLLTLCRFNIFHLKNRYFLMPFIKSA